MMIFILDASVTSILIITMMAFMSSLFSFLLNPFIWKANK